MAQWTAVEQLMLELVNRARLDPLGEARRLGIDLNEGLAAGTIKSTPVQVLAPDSLLNDAASAHSLWMLQTDTFSHTGAGGSSAGERMTAAGYRFSTGASWGENIAWQGTTGTVNPAAFVIAEHESLFRSPGHRLNILNATFSEVGIAAETGKYDAYDAVMTTQNFAKSGTGVFVTGVAYTDRDRDAFYDVGEGRSGIAVAANVGTTTGTDTTGTAGGYAAEVVAGLVNVTFSGGGLAKPISAVVDARAGNVKVDLVDGQRLDTSATLMLVDNVLHAKLLGVANASLTGNLLSNTLTGNAGRNNMYGGGGNDTLNGGLGNDYMVGGAGSDKLLGEAGNDYLTGSAGLDTLTGGLGADTFFFNAQLVRENIDRIADFNATDDTIRLDDSVFTALATGALAAGAFTVGSAATKPEHRIIHYKGGTLSYDPDGNGELKPLQFATLTSGLTLTAADFVVV